MAGNRFSVADKYLGIYGTTDAPSSGSALLAVLCALEGGHDGPRYVSSLKWEGGQHEDGSLIAIS